MDTTLLLLCSLEPFPASLEFKHSLLRIALELELNFWLTWLFDPFRGRQSLRPSHTNTSLPEERLELSYLAILHFSSVSATGSISQGGLRVVWIPPEPAAHLGNPVPLYGLPLLSVLEGGGMLFGFYLTPVSVWLSTAVCFILLLVSAFHETSWCFQLMTPKCLTLNLWLWSPYQPPPSFACWGLPLAMPSYGGGHVYLELACTLASNCHLSCLVITVWYQAGSLQKDSPAYPTGMAALALCGCPLSCWGAHLLPSGSGDGVFFPLCLDRICPFYFASWSL